MRKLKKQAKKARRKMLEEDTFLEDVLLPMIDGNEAVRPEKRKHNKLTAVIAAGMTSVVAIVTAIVLIFTLYKPDTLYVGKTETTASDIITVNQALANTQITGAFDSISLSYNSKTLKQHYFTVRKEIMTEEIFADLRIVLLVDRDFNYDAEENEYTGVFEYLGYNVEFTEKVKETMYEDIPVNEFTVMAFFDTGNECFYISYSEISIKDESGFAEYLNNTIIKK